MTIEKIKVYRDLISDLEKEAEELNVLIGSIRKRIDLLETENKVKEPLMTKEGKYSYMTGIQAAKIVMTEKRKPEHISKICDEINRNGGKTNARSLYSGLVRSDDFERIGRGIFSLKGWHRPKEENLNEKKESAPLA